MKKLFLLLPLFILAACNQNEPSVNSNQNGTKYNILCDSKSPYLEWYLGGQKSVTQYTFIEYPYVDNVSSNIILKQMEDNTIMLNEKLGLHIHDTCLVDYEEKNTSFRLIRQVSLATNQQKKVKRAEKEADWDWEQIEDTIEVIVPTAQPISIYSPASTTCNAIPLCYYDDMEITWNADYDNTEGVIVVAEWDGVTLDNDPVGTTIVGIDIVEDTGNATLNNDLFEGMPDGALVNLWLIRGNIVGGNNSSTTLTELIAAANGDLGELQALLEGHPEYIYQMQEVMFASGTAAVLHMFLIREL